MLRASRQVKVDVASRPVTCRREGRGEILEGLCEDKEKFLETVIAASGNGD